MPLHQFHHNGLYSESHFYQKVVHYMNIHTWTWKTIVILVSRYHFIIIAIVCIILLLLSAYATSLQACRMRRWRIRGSKVTGTCLYISFITTTYIQSLTSIKKLMHYMNIYTWTWRTIVILVSKYHFIIIASICIILLLLSARATSLQACLNNIFTIDGTHAMLSTLSSYYRHYVTYFTLAKLWRKFD